jgi:hypothetical protein
VEALKAAARQRMAGGQQELDLVSSSGPRPGRAVGDRVVVCGVPVGRVVPRLRRGRLHYQYRADQARRTLRGIDEQITKAEKTGR